MPNATLSPPLALDLDAETVRRVAEIFDTLSDPTRIQIIAALSAGELGAGELSERVGLSKSAASHQLRSLRDRRIVRTRRDGRRVFVSLDDEHVSELFRRCLEHVQHG